MAQHCKLYKSVIDYLVMFVKLDESIEEKFKHIIVNTYTGIFNES